MSSEIRISFVVRLPDEADQSAAHCQAIWGAWATFTGQTKATNVVVNDFYLGPTKPVRGRPRRSRARLAAVGSNMPESAA